MTENKRFTNDIHRIYDNNEEIACADTMDDAEILVDLLNEKEELIKRLKEELFEARKDYIVDTADISDKPYLDEMIEEERKEIYGGVEWGCGMTECKLSELCLKYSEVADLLNKQEKRIKELEKENMECYKLMDLILEKNLNLNKRW